MNIRPATNGNSQAKLLLATDGSEEASLAARVASDLAERAGAELHVVHAWHEPPGAHPHRHAGRDLALRAEEELKEQARRIEASGATVTGSYLRRGPTVGEILDVAGDIDAGLIVVGSRGLGRMERKLLGSVSEGVVHNSDRPVLVVRGKESWPPERIIVGDDSFEDVNRAEEFAAGLGECYDSRLILVRNHQQPAANEEAPPGSGSEVRAFAGGSVADSVLRVDREERKPALIIAGSPEPTAGRKRFGRDLDKIMRSARGPFLFYPQDPAKAYTHRATTRQMSKTPGGRT